MYNLLIGFSEGLADKSRVFEYTDDALKAYFAPSGTVDLARLVRLPTLVMPETGTMGVRQVARVGHIEDLSAHGSNSYRYRFVAAPDVPEIHTGRIEANASRLQISEWEFRRTHWAVKDIDLYRVLRESVIGSAALSPQVFRFPTELVRDPDLVAVMMPFDARFDPVYEALREAVTNAGLQCHRADDIWEHDHIMDDVIRLIWQARVVVADLSTKNPNVFYETGIAHSLGRDVIQIAQSINDVPFDLRSLRTIVYLPNGEGIMDLKNKVTARLSKLTGP